MSEQNKWDKYKVDSEETKTESTSTENKWDKYAVEGEPVKKKGSTPSQLGSVDGTFKSTTGVSAQPIQKISDFAPQGSKKLVQPTPFTVPAATVKETVQRIEDNKSIANAEKMQGVDKSLVLEKVNEKALELNKMLDEDKIYRDEVVTKYNIISDQYKGVSERLNNEKSSANRAILMKEAGDLELQLSNYDKEAKRIADAINKKEIVANNLYRATNAIKQVDEKEKLPQNFGEELYESLKSGSAQLGSSIAKVPGFVYDTFAIPQNLIAEKTGLDVGTTSKEFAAQQLGVEENEVANYYDNIINQHQKDISAKYDKSITDYFANGQIADGLKLLSNRVLESAPISASMMMGNAAGISTMPMFLGGATVFGAQEKSAYDKDVDVNLSESDKMFNAWSKGLFEGGTELFGITKLGGIARGVLENEGKQAAVDFAKQTFKETYMPIATKYLGNQAEEIIGETANQFASNVVDKYSGAKPNIDLTDGLSDAAIIAFGSSTSMSTPISALEVLQTKSAKKGATIKQNIIEELSDGKDMGGLLQNKPLYDKAVEIANNPQEMELFQKQLDREVKSGAINIDEANNTMNAIQAIAETENLIPPTIKSKEARLAAVNIIAEKRLLEQQIEGKEKGLVEPQVERIKALDESLKLISRGTAVEEVQNFLKPTETITESALAVEEQEPTLYAYDETVGDYVPVKKQLTTPTETIIEKAVETPVAEQVNEGVVPQELTVEEKTPQLEVGAQIEYSKDGGKTFEIGIIQTNENGILRITDEEGVPRNVNTNKEGVIINPINKVAVIEDDLYNESRRVTEIVSQENPEASVLITPKGNDLSLTAVYVGKEKRGQGIGTKVLESVKRQADILGKKIVLDATNKLDSETDLERLGNFYEKNGFTKIGENKFEYNPIKTEKNAINQGNIEQGNQPEYQGIVGQEQGQQEDRNNQEGVIAESQTETGGGNSVIESGQIQEEVVKQPKQFEGESWNNTGTNFSVEGNVKEFTAKNGQNYNITESEDNGNVFVSINDSNGENIASAYFIKQSDGTYEAKEVFTKDDLRGNNIAKAMYDYIDNYKGEILPSANQSEEGRGLWENNYKQPTEQTKPIKQTDGTETKQPVAGNRLFNKPIEAAKQIADRYFKSAFGTKRNAFKGTRKLDKERSKRIAIAFKEMKNEPNNPKVKAAYEAMVKETLDQYKEIIKDGYFIEINNSEAYANSEEMIEDLRNNKRMKIFSTEAGYGDAPITQQQRNENPLLRDSGYKDANGVTLLNNDIFRAVHDFFGHAELGNSFGALGEENAWNVHARMYSPLARAAVTTETRGQNSYVNFSGVNEQAKKLLDKAAQLRKEGKIKEALEITDNIYNELLFAEQKIGLLPDEFNEIDETFDGDIAEQAVEQPKYKRADEKAEAEQIDFKGNEDEYYRFVASETTDPSELAENYLLINERDYTATKERVRGMGGALDFIRDYLSSRGIQREDYAHYGDENNIGFAMAKAYFHNPNALPLDLAAMEISEEAGVEVTEEDIIGYIDYQDRKRFDLKSTPLKTKFKDKYRELTGRELDPAEAKRLLTREAKQYTKDYEKFIEQESRNANQLEQQFYEAIARGEIIDEGGEIDSPNQGVSPTPQGEVGLADQTIATLEAMKIKSKGLQSNIFGIPIAVYNFALDTIILGIKAGKTLREAIQEAIIKHNLVEEAAKANNLTTDSQKAKLERNIAEELEEEVNDKMASMPPPIPAQGQPAQKQGGERESQFYQSVKAQMIDPNQTQKLSEVPNPMYIEMKNEDTMAEVNKLIESKTIENLEAQLLSDEGSAKLEGNVRVVAMIKLADALQTESIALQDTDPETSNTLFERSQKLYAEASQVLTKAGRTVQAAAMILYGYGSYQSAVMQFRKKVDKANEKAKTQSKEKAKKDVEAVSSDTDMAAQEAVEEVIKDYKPKKKKTLDEIKAVRKNIKAKLKSGKNKYFNSSLGLTLEGAKLAGELAKTYIEEGIIRAKDIISKIKQDFLDEGYKLTESDEKKITSEIGKVSLEVKLSTMDETLTQIAKQHYDTRKKKTKSLAEKIVEELGLTEPEATQIANEIEAKVEAKLKEKINKRFEKQLKTAKEKKDEALQEKKRLGREEQKAQEGNEVDILLRAALDGTISEDLMQDMFKEKYGITEITQEDLAYIKEQYDKIAKIADPDTFITYEFFKNVTDRITSKVGKSGWLYLDALWYASTLSGFATQDVNATFIVRNAMQAAADTMIMGAIKTAKNPKEARNLLQFWLAGWVEGFRGFRTGLTEARYILKYGNSSFAENISQIERESEKELNFKDWLPKWIKKAAPIFNMSKIVGRALQAADYLGTRTIAQSAVYPIVYEKYKKLGHKGNELRQLVITEVMLGKDAYKKAEIQALKDTKIKYPTYSDKELTKTLTYKRRVNEIINSRISTQAVNAATKVAREYTLTGKVKGFLGMQYELMMENNANRLAKAQKDGSLIAKYWHFAVSKITPFLKTPLNYVNTGFDYSPVGFARAYKGSLFGANKREFDTNERERMYAKAIAGTAMLGVYLLNNFDDIFGEALGEDDEEDKKIRQKYQDAYYKMFGVKLELDNPIFSVPKKGQLCGSLNMLSPQERNFLTQMGIAKEYAEFDGEKWIYSNNNSMWFINGFVGTLANYKKYIVNNKYREEDAFLKKQGYDALTANLMFGTIEQILELGSLKGTQSLSENMSYKQGDPLQKGAQLLKTTALQVLNPLKPSFVSQMVKYFDGVARYPIEKSEGATGFIMQYAPVAGWFWWKGEEMHDSFGRPIRRVPGEGKAYISTLYADWSNAQGDDLEAKKIANLLYMSGVKTVPNMAKNLNLTNSDKSQHEVSFKDWNRMDKMAKQIAYNELKVRLNSNQKSVSVKPKIPSNGKLIDSNENLKTNGLVSVANTSTQEELSKPNSYFLQQIQDVYNRAQLLVKEDYIRNNVK